MTLQEQEFKNIYDNKGFKFSYSSLNRLKFSPKLFYKDYILKNKEIRTDKHLIEGKLLHLLLLQPENFSKQFSKLPGKVPSDAVRRVLNEVKDNAGSKKTLDVLQVEVIAALKHQDLYQSMKSDQKKFEKIDVPANQEYFKFLLTQEGKDIIDQTMYDKCENNVLVIKENKAIMDLLDPVVTDFELDDTETFNEQYLECELKDLKFGLKGYVDRYIVDHKNKAITIIDLKTSGKSLAQFPETVEFYNYWLQAAVYTMLVMKNVDEKAKNYKINFNFIVIDAYSQVYNFEVRPETLQTWGGEMIKSLDAGKYHLDNMNFDLPHEFLTNKVFL
tara:strand:- start:3077 stop:4069 length:993 start_codon:yes stop_codon:yes gene_type:complete